MKRTLLLLLSSFLVFTARAQNPSIERQTYNSNDFMSRLLKKKSSISFRDTTIVLTNPSLLKSRKPGVYRLPQDNMPCIVPDTTKTVRMPNAWKGPLRVPYKSNPPRIPNLAKPPQNS